MDIEAIRKQVEQQVMQYFAADVVRGIRAV